MNIKDKVNLIEKLHKKRRIVSLKKGLYMVVPISAIDKKWALDEFKIIDYFIKNNYYIGLYNAFNLYGFTEQIPNKMFVFNTKYSADRTILNLRYKFFKINKNKIFGITNDKYPYSDKERTIIDALDYNNYLGTLNEVMERIKAQKYDKSRLVDYAIKYNSIKVMKLVGMLTNSHKLLNVLKRKNALTYYTTIKRAGTKLLEKKWKIRLI
jgi:predicted transcriptional regulator of viral defense system